MVQKLDYLATGTRKKAFIFFDIFQRTSPQVFEKDILGSVKPTRGLFGFSKDLLMKRKNVELEVVSSNCSKKRAVGEISFSTGIFFLLDLYLNL